MRAQKGSWDFHSISVDISETARILGHFPISPVPDHEKEALLNENLKNGTKFEIIRETSISWSDSLEPFFKCLAHNQTITTLLLADGDWPKAVWLHLCEALMTNKSVTRIQYEGNSMYLEGANALAKVLRQNTTLRNLDIGDNEIPESGTKKIFAALQSNSTLQRLSYYENQLNQGASNSIGEMLKINQGLVELDLSCTGLDCRGIRSIVEGLRTNKTLKEIYFCYLGQSVDVSLASIISEMLGFSAVKSIGLNMCEKRFFCKELDGFEYFGPDQMRILVRHLSRSAIQTLNLGSLHMFAPGGGVLGKALSSNKTLTTLDLSYANLGLPPNDRGFAGLCSNLETHPALTRLDISGNDLTDRHASSISSLIRNKNKLRYLNIGSNPNLGEKAIASILSALETNRSIQNLQFRNSKLGSQSISGLAEVIKNNQTILEININANLCYGHVDISDRSFIKLFQSLLKTQSLEAFDFASESTTELSDKAIYHLYQMIKQNTSLKSFTFVDANLKFKHLIKLCEAINNNQTLQSLILEPIELSVEEKRAVGQGLQMSFNLKKIRLFKTPDNVSSREILSRNHFVTDIGYFGDDKLATYFDFMIKMNRIIRKGSWKIYYFLRLIWYGQSTDPIQEIVSRFRCYLIQRKINLLDFGSLEGFV